MSILYVCDHCKKTIDRWVGVLSDQNRGVFGVRSYHLCEDCFEKFKEFMNEEPEVSFVPISEGKKRFFKR